MRSMKFNPEDTIYHRTFTDDLARNFQAFCDNVKASSKFVGTIMVSEVELSEDDNVFFKIPHDLTKTLIVRVQEAVFQINGGLARYVAYYPADPEKIGFFITHITPGFFEMFSSFIDECGCADELIAFEKNVPEGSVILHDLQKRNFDRLIGTADAPSSVLEFILRSAPKA